MSKKEKAHLRQQIINETLQELGKAAGDGRLVILPCKYGDRLWWVLDDDDNPGNPWVEQSNPVLAFSMEPGQPVKVTTDGCSFDPVGGPDLFLTRDEAETVRLDRLLRARIKRREEEYARQMSSEQRAAAL